MHQINFLNYLHQVAAVSGLRNARKLTNFTFSRKVSFLSGKNVVVTHLTGHLLLRQKKECERKCIEKGTIAEYVC